MSRELHCQQLVHTKYKALQHPAKLSKGIKQILSMGMRRVGQNDRGQINQSPKENNLTQNATAPALALKNCRSPDRWQPNFDVDFVN